MPRRPDAPPIDRRARGAAVEAVALAHLSEQGLRLIARNAHCRLGELDLVMRDGTTVVFVEVRYRAHAGYGGGAASVDTAKQRRLIRAAQVFLKRQPSLAHAPCRFDVVEARGDPAEPELHWIRAAFRVDGP
jgi:putative endonuclease